MKYILFQLGDQLIPVLFPDQMVHRDMAHAIQGWPFLRMKDATIVSAGTVSGVTCSMTSDESKTLNVVARDEDATVINTYDYCFGLPNPNARLIESQVLLATAQAIMSVLTGDGSEAVPE